MQAAYYFEIWWIVVKPKHAALQPYDIKKSFTVIDGYYPPVT